MSTVILVLVIIFMLVGIVGTLVPVIPGTIITGLSAFSYAWYNGFEQVSVTAAVWIVLLTVVTGTADLWMPLLGAKAGGASLRTMLFGIAGAMIGFVLGSVIPILGNLIGAVTGYVGGILLAEYLKYEDWDKALKAAVGGLAGWGLATAVQLGGAILITIIFLWQVLV